MASTETVQGTDPRTLIAPELREKIAAAVRKQFPDMLAETADTGVGQMVAFLHACAASVRPLSPSPLVDDFWHAFLMDTEAYSTWCAEAFGRMVHHKPGFLSPEEGGGKELRARAVDVMATMGFLLEMEFWPEIELANCSQCHANCSDSPFHGTARPKG